MDTLDGSEFDVLIAGTGIQQSLLALALSRSDKKVLHIDKNDFYGGAEAAFSLNEAESWVKTLQEDGDKSTLFRNASISTSTTSDDATNVRLASSNRYSLALAPQLIYTDSKLLDSLVSSKVYKQLEFQAMGSWFVYEKGEADTTGTLLKIPTTREDLVFSDKSIDIRSKRAVMKVLRFLVEFESQEETWRPYADKPFSHFLNKQFKLPDRLHGLFYALTLSLEGPEHTTTAFALPRIARHLRTTGIIGPGFNSVIHKYGGLSEIAQLACRAGAVGGAVYVLNKDLKDMGPVTHESGNVCPLSTTLSDGEKVQASWVVGTRDNIPVLLASNDTQPISSTSSTRRSVAIVSSPFLSLFPPLGEGAATPAGAVVVFPAGSLAGDSLPVYLIVHSSDTGDCPQGQSVIYATTRGPSELLDSAIRLLTDLVDEEPPPASLWTLKYEQHESSAVPEAASGISVVLPTPSSDLAFDETILAHVKEAWQKIMGAAAEEQDFLVFEDRNQDRESDEDL